MTTLLLHPAWRRRWCPTPGFADLAAIEFVPPKTITPWEAALLLREQTDDRSVGAWFSTQAGDDVITMSRNGDDDDELVLAQGPKYEQADGETRGVLCGGVQR
ncbi:MAG: hypothetical protein WKF58_13235 [Ilumatobacteraceae bacterium]